MPRIFWPALALVLAFTAWCVWLVRAVERERDQVSARVGWLGEAQGLQRTLGQGASIDAALQRLADEVETGGAGAAVHSALITALGASEATLRHEALDGFVRAVRGETAALSQQLGKRWSALYVLTLAALLSAIMVLALLVVATWRRREAEALQVSLAEAMAEVEQARADAEAASVNKTNYVTHMSHELRTPLNVILGYTALLRDAPALAGDAETREDLRQVAQAGEHLLGLVNTILDISRIEAGRLELRPEPFDARVLVDTVVGLLRGQAAPGVVLRAEVAPTLGRLQGDPQRLRQVIVNMVANALRFTANGSVVVSMVGSPGAVRVEVVDTGAGISSEGLARLFRPFVQVSGDRRGSGIGLALCKQLVEAMGGQIGAESELGVGSRFWFVVPLPAA